MGGEMDIGEVFDRILPAIRTAREIGRVPSVTCLVSRVEHAVLASGNDAAIQGIEEDKAWILWAQEQERLNGVDCLVDWTHPVYLQAQDGLERHLRLREGSPVQGR